MKMKKHLLAGALAVGLGVGAASLPQDAVAAPTAQVGFGVNFLLRELWNPVPFDRLLFFWRDSAGCAPWTLSAHCTGRPAFPGERKRPWSG